MTEPIVDRPRIPAEYGVATGTRALLPWSHVVRRLTDAPIYWIATVGRGGRPRVRPIDGTFVDGVLYVGGSPETAWVRDLTANGAVSVNLDGAERMDVVIVEGDAEWLEPPHRSGAGRRSWQPRRTRSTRSTACQTADDVRKRRAPGRSGPTWAVAWTDFAKNPTRFRFPGDGRGPSVPPLEHELAKRLLGRAPADAERAVLLVGEREPEDPLDAGLARTTGRPLAGTPTGCRSRSSGGPSP